MTRIDSPLTEHRNDYEGTQILPPFFDETPEEMKIENDKEQLLNNLGFRYAEMPDFLFKNYLKVSTIEDHAEYPEDFEEGEYEEFLGEDVWFELPVPEMK